MGTKSDEIVNQIDKQRDRLGQNLHELESRFRDATDWHVQYERHPWALLGVAFVGGMLFGAWTRSGSGKVVYAGGNGSHSASNQVMEALRGALITLAVNKLKDYVSTATGSQQEHPAG